MFEGVLTDSVAALLAVGAVKLTRVAQDGMRVRASAGAGSFRRRGTLERCLDAAKAQVATLKQQAEDDPGALTRRQQAARERAQRERQARIEQAPNRWPELEALKVKQGKKAEETRASTTDVEATVIKMGDGGYRPAYNAQYATDTESQVIVGVEVVTVGSDMGQLAPMVKQVTERSGVTPGHGLVDGATRPMNTWTAWQNTRPCTRRYPSRKTPLTIRMCRRPVTVRQWPRGAYAWGRKPPKPCTKSGRRQPNVSIPWRESAG